VWGETFQKVSLTPAVPCKSLHQQFLTKASFGAISGPDGQIWIIVSFPMLFNVVFGRIIGSFKKGGNLSYSFVNLSAYIPLSTHDRSQCSLHLQVAKYEHSLFGTLQGNEDHPS